MEQLRSDHSQAVETLKFKHQHEIDNLDKTTAERIQKLKDEAAKEKAHALKSLEDEFQNKIKQLKSDNEKFIAKLNQQFD
jgi:gas vesicle protein